MRRVIVNGNGNNAGNPDNFYYDPSPLRNWIVTPVGAKFPRATNAVNDSGGLEYILAHELGHAMDVGQRNKTFDAKVNQNRDIYGKLLNSHDKMPEETYADLVSFRDWLYRAGIYDSRTGEPFTEAHYNRAMNSGMFDKVPTQKEWEKYMELDARGKEKWDKKRNKHRVRILQQMPKDALINMMNTIAMSDFPNNNEYYA